MPIENGLSTFPVGRNPEFDSTGSAPAMQNPNITTTPDSGLPLLTDFQKGVIPRYMNHLEKSGDLAGDFAVTKLNAQTGGTGAETAAGTAQPPGSSGIYSGTDTNRKPALLNDPQALARRQARENATRNNTYGEFDPSSGGTKALTSSPDPESLRVKNSRPLTEYEKQWLRERGNIVGTLDLDQVRIHEDERDAPIFMPKDKNGMTLENHVHLRETCDDKGNCFKYNPSKESTYWLLEHELQHVQQFQNGMTRAGYLWDAGTKGYKNSQYEQEAYETGHDPTEDESQQP